MPSESITKLNETNCDTWSLVMKALLIRKDLWDVIDGSESHPTSKTNSKAVWAYEKKIQHSLNRDRVHAIRMSMSPHPTLLQHCQ